MAETTTGAPDTQAAPPATSPDAPVVTEQPAPEKAPDAKQESLAKNFGILAKQKKAFDDEKKAFAADRKKHEEDRAAWQRDQDELRELVKSDALEGIRRWAKKYGYEGDPYEAMTRAALRKPKQGEQQPPMVAEIRAELETLKKQLAERQEAEEKRAAEERTRAEQKQVDDYKQSIREHIMADGAKYKAIIASEEEGFESVYSLIATQYQIDRKEKGDAAEPLSIEEAAGIMEEQILKRLKRYAAVIEPQAIAAPVEAQDAPKETRVGTRTSPDGPTTLTNGHAAQAVSAGTTSTRLGDQKRREEKERFERALKKLG